MDRGLRSSEWDKMIKLVIDKNHSWRRFKISKNDLAAELSNFKTDKVRKKNMKFLLLKQRRKKV